MHLQAYCETAGHFESRNRNLATACILLYKANVYPLVKLTNTCCLLITKFCVYAA